MPSTPSPRIAIVGAGFGGIGMAINLRRQGVDSFEVFERADHIGGVWRENTYPGAGCDVPSPFYSFSFAPNARWPWRYAKQSAILAYLEQCVDRFRVRDHLHLRAEVTHARFDESTNRWQLSVNGEIREFEVLICACGQLSEPSIPDFRGRDLFRGHSFHSAEWDHDHDLHGRRVAVIGTGASAIQFVPEIVPQVRELYLFARSAPFVLLKPDREYSRRHQRLFERVPGLLAGERLGWFLVCEYGQIALSDHPGWLDPWGKLAMWHLKHVVEDPSKRAALTPQDHPGCKRLLFSNHYYRAVGADHVTVIPEGVAAITPAGVISTGGVQCEVDTIIYATGFASHGFVAPMTITGRAGRDLTEDAWATGASAYLGMTVPDFPNMFLLYGPNTNLGTGSIVHMLESSIHYITEAVAEIRGHPGTALSVRQGRAWLYDDEIQRRLRGSVWATGCRSWYVDESGRNANNWPGTMSEYRRRTRRFIRADFDTLEAPVLASAGERRD